MRSTFSILPYINRNKVKADGTTSVMCRISIDGKSSVFSTGIYCRPEDWNTEKGEIREQRANNRLIELRNKLEQTYEKYLKTKGVVSAELLKNEITQANTVPEYLLQAGEEERERLKVRSVEIRSTSSYRQSKSTQAYLREYLLTLKMTDIAFEDITEDFGYGFKQFVKSKGCKASHINHCMTWLNRLIYIAVDREILRFNPIADVPYEKKEAPKLNHISRSQLQLIMERPMPNKWQELTRRVFIFSAFTSLAYVDMKELYPHHIGKTAEGRRYIRINRKKTGVESFIPLHPVAEQILELYNTTDDTKPVFPLPNRDMLWYAVNEIGVLAGVKGTLSHHTARHSFDIRSSKVFSLLVGMGVVCSLSLWGNIRLWQSNRQYADDALKFRAIRSWSGCTQGDILWLNKVFDIQRDEKAIEWVRKQADGYENELKAISDSLMQEKLKLQVESESD